MAISPDTLGIHPFSTQDGRHIPHDILRPLNLYRQDFTDSPSAEIALPDDAEIVIVWATRSCVIRLGGIVSIPSSGSSISDTLTIPGNTFITVDLNGLTSFSVVGMAEAGTLFVNHVQKWKDMRKQTQYNRN